MSAPTTRTPVAPHGGVLQDLLAVDSEREALRRKASTLPSCELSDRQLDDLELLLNGAFSPLTGFMGQADYEQVLGALRLTSGLLWPIPVTLDIDEDLASRLSPGAALALLDTEGTPLAVLEISDLWRPDRSAEARAVYGTLDTAHPGVDAVLNQPRPVYVGGRVHGIEAPPHHDFIACRHAPRELRATFMRLGWQRVVAFQTADFIHRDSVALTLCAARAADANILLHPVVPHAAPDNADHYTRVRACQKALGHYPEGMAVLSLLPLSMRVAGPREALWHAIIHKNYGCTHFIVAHDHADPGGGTGKAFHPPDAARELIRAHQGELGIEILSLPEMLYVAERAEHVPANELKPGERTLRLSAAEVRRRLSENLEIPAWFSYPDVLETLRHAQPPKYRQGVTVFFTGLSGAGKSTIAKALLARLLELGERSVTLLDGDVVRKHLSSELGFSHAHRDLNILRIGFVAAEITKHGGIALCAPIAPYTATRREVRRMVSAHGGFFEVHVATPLEVCEERDRKGLYARARAGQIRAFTGISDPYEMPEHPEMVIDTSETGPLEAVAAIMTRLATEGFLGR